MLVEDDLADQKLIKASLRNQKIANDLYVVNSGEEALDFLYHRGNYAKDTSRPELILLDLNMPVMEHAPNNHSSSWLCRSRQTAGVSLLTLFLPATVQPLLTMKTS